MTKIFEFAKMNCDHLIFFQCKKIYIETLGFRLRDIFSFLKNMTTVYVIHYYGWFLFDSTQCKQFYQMLSEDQTVIIYFV